MMPNPLECGPGSLFWPTALCGIGFFGKSVGLDHAPAGAPGPLLPPLGAPAGPSAGDAPAGALEIHPAAAPAVAPQNVAAQLPLIPLLMMPMPVRPEYHPAGAPAGARRLLLPPVPLEALLYAALPQTGTRA